MYGLETQTKNIVAINGKLVSVNLREGTTKTGKPYIGGRAIVRVNQSYLGIEETSQIPVSFFSTKYTSKGSSNPSYENIKGLMNMKSIEQVGEAEADNVRMRNASVRENAYVSSRSGAIVDGWQVDASFIEKGSGADSATISLKNVVIIDKKPEIDRNTGDETGRLFVKVGVVQYGAKLDVLDFVIDDPNSAMQVDNTWDINSTVSIWGRVRVITKEEKRPVSTSSWGEDAPTSVSTRTIRELVLTGGELVDDEDLAYDIAEVKKGFNQRKALREQMLSDSSTKAAPASAPKKQAYGWE